MSVGLVVLGSTGSIGRATLEVVEEHCGRLHVEALASFGRRLDLLEVQVRAHGPRLVAVHDRDAAAELRRRLGGDGPRVVDGEEGVVEAACVEGGDRVVAAMVGAAGLRPVAAAVEMGRSVALANKESLVVGGRWLVELARTTGAALVPIDSEHVALDQALRAGERHEVRRLILTASGGPFLDRDPATWTTIRPEEALRHPTWDMGAKISIDSATLMNKGLELIEAVHLFRFPADKVDVVIHPQSIVHSLVEYRDGSVIAQMSPNDMRGPIQYALSFPDRWPSSRPGLGVAQLDRLEFRSVEDTPFRGVALAREAVAAGESAPAVLNAANEVAVGEFLSGRIRFPEITAVLERVLECHLVETVDDLESALGWDRWGRDRAAAVIAELTP